jgi:hypothetical protein
MAATAVTEVPIQVTVADVQAPHSRGHSTAVQGILLLLVKTLEHGLSGDPQRQVTGREGHQRTAIPIGASAEPEVGETVTLLDALARH